MFILEATLLRKKVVKLIKLIARLNLNRSFVFFSDILHSFYIIPTLL